MSTTSVIIPTFNHGSELLGLLKCFDDQILKPDEIIVVDDGSTDNTSDIIAPYLDRIIYIRQENKGAPTARNKGFEASSGDFLLFLDADLDLRSDMISKMHAALSERPEIGFVYSSFKFGFKKFPGFDFSLERLKKMPYIPTSSMIRREWFFGFDESLKRFQDWDLFLGIGLKGGIGLRIPEYLFSAKPRKAGISKWFPNLFLKMPFLKRVREYENAKKIILSKYNLDD